MGVTSRLSSFSPFRDLFSLVVYPIAFFFFFKPKNVWNSERVEFGLLERHGGPTATGVRFLVCTFFSTNTIPKAELLPGHMIRSASKGIWA